MGGMGIERLYATNKHLLIYSGSKNQDKLYSFNSAVEFTVRPRNFDLLMINNIFCISKPFQSCPLLDLSLSFFTVLIGWEGFVILDAFVL